MGRNHYRIHITNTCYFKEYHDILLWYISITQNMVIPWYSDGVRCKYHDIVFVYNGKHYHNHIPLYIPGWYFKECHRITIVHIHNNNKVLPWYSTKVLNI